MPTGKRRNLVIAIDGPAGSGKSSTAKALAKRLKIPYIDTGAMYRAVTLKAVRSGIDLRETPKLVAMAKKARIRLSGTDPAKQKVFLDGRQVTREIRDPELTKKVFYAAQEPLVRQEMVKRQRRMGKAGGAVMEGRDIGTVVFPDADYKFYFTADAGLRARRRWKELQGAGRRMSLRRVLEDQERRDRTDYERKEGALRPAGDAVILDTTKLTINQTVDKIIGHIRCNPLKPRKLGRWSTGS